MTAARDRKKSSTRPRRSIQASAEQAKRRQRMLNLLGAGLLLVGIVIVVLIAINSRDEPETAGPVTDVATVIAADELPDDIAKNGTVLGDPNAPVLIVEYGDYQCPFCKKFAVQDMPQLIDEYVATGKVRVEYRQYPIIGSGGGEFDQDGESFKAAEAAYCAADQGEFWPMHEALYLNSVGEFRGSFTVDRLNRIAATVPGLDTGAFASCLESGANAQRVLDSAVQAQADGVSSTPTFLVGDRMVRGADYDALKAAIDAQLAGR